MHSSFATAPHFTVIGSCFVVIALVTKAADTHAPDPRFRRFVALYTVNADIIFGLIPTSRDISVLFYRSRRSRSIGLNASSS
jgi:hypothetical protein